MRLKVTSRKSVWNRLVSAVMFSLISWKALIMFFLVHSISGPNLFLRTASPSSRYKSRYFVGMIFDSVFKINSPTSSHILSPLKDPGAKRCNLCLVEKLAILQADQCTLLNKRSEFVSKCQHWNKFKLKKA